MVLQEYNNNTEKLKLYSNSLYIRNHGQKGVFHNYSDGLAGLFNSSSGKMDGCKDLTGLLRLTIILLSHEIVKIKNNVTKYQESPCFFLKHRNCPKISCWLLNCVNSWLQSLICHLKHFRGCHLKLITPLGVNLALRRRMFAWACFQQKTETQG